MFTNSRSLPGLTAILLCLTIGAWAGPPSPVLKKEKFHLEKIGEDDVGYAQAVRVGSVIYISGSVGEGPDMPTQLRQAYESIERSLAHYGATFRNVVKENIFATDLAEMIKHKDIRRQFYHDDWPAASWVGVKSLYHPGLLVQVEVVAEVPPE